MPRVIDNKCYYTMHEVCSRVGICKSTLSRWIKKNPYCDAQNRDRNGWRLYSEDEVEKLNKEYNILYFQQSK